MGGGQQSCKCFPLSLLPSISFSFFFLFVFPTFSVFKEYVSTVFVKTTQNYYKKLSRNIHPKFYYKKITICPSRDLSNEHK